MYPSLNHIQRPPMRNLKCQTEPDKLQVLLPSTPPAVHICLMIVASLLRPTGTEETPG